MMSTDEPVEKPGWPEGFWDPAESAPPKKHWARDWSPGFWEEVLRLAPEVDIEVPEPLPPSPHRDVVLDELGRD